MSNLEELIGKFIRDNETGDIGQVVELKNYGFRKKKEYYLIKWVHKEDKVRHEKANYAQYKPEKLMEPNGRFEVLTGSEALFYVL